MTEYTAKFAGIETDDRSGRPRALFWKKGGGTYGLDIPEGLNLDHLQPDQAYKINNENFTLISYQPVQATQTPQGGTYYKPSAGPGVGHNGAPQPAQGPSQPVDMACVTGILKSALESGKIQDAPELDRWAKAAYSALAKMGEYFP